MFVRIRYLRAVLVLSFCFIGFSCASEEEKIARHYERARVYIANNELREAVIELRNVIEMDPENDVALCDLGKTYLKLKEDEEAVQFFNRAIKANPDNLEAQLKTGQIFLIIEETKAARNTVTSLLKKAPRNIDALHLLSGVQIQENNSDAAIKTLKKVISIDPNCFKSHLFMAHIFFSKGELDAAEQAYLKALSLESSRRMPYMELSFLYGSRGQWDRVESILKKMVQVPGERHQKLTDLAKFYESQSKWIQAEQAYKAAVDAAPDGEASLLVNLGLYYARRKSYDNALESFQKALDIKKNDLNILMIIARLQVEHNKWKDAEVTVDKILSENDGHVEANLLKGRFCLIRKDFPSALARFDFVIKKDPENAMPHYYMALCLIGKGGRGFSELNLLKAAAGYGSDTESWERKLVEDSLLKAVAYDPEFLPPRLLLAENYLLKGKLIPAREQIEFVLKASPNDILVLMLEVRLKISERDFNGAEHICKRILELNPHYVPAHIRLGFIYSHTKQNAYALKSFNKALELDPFKTEALGLIIDIMIGDKKFDEALKICERHKLKTADNSVCVADIEYLEGNIFIALGDMKKARPHFEAAIKSDPKMLPSHMALARIYAEEKKISEVISQYEAVLRKKPDHLEACMSLGMVYEGQGEIEMAKRYYKEALEIKGDFVPAANNLAFILAETYVQVDEALRLAEFAKMKRPKDAIVSDTLGWVYYKMGRYESAVSELEISVKLNSDNALANYHLGWAYYETKQFAKAREFMSRALKLDPNFKGAEKARSLVSE